LYRKSSNLESPSTRCVPQGIPRGDLDNYLPFKILQTPGVIAVLYEESNTYRQIYTDGRKLPADPQPTWMGYSVGRWEGDTLVVDSAGFNEQGWLDASGHPQSEKLQIRERFHRRDFGHMDLELTIDDPQIYTKPFTIKRLKCCYPIAMFWSMSARKTKRTVLTSESDRWSCSAPAGARSVST
jgi:hypothetical protein